MECLHQEIESIALYEYRIPFKRPLVLAAGELYDRKVLLSCCEVEGKHYWCEVAPLPGFSSETLQSCVKQLKEIYSRRCRYTFASLADELNKAGHLFPSISYALNHLISTTNTNGESRSLNICSLYLGEGTPPGSPVIKIKVGQASIEDDIKRIHGLLSNKAFNGKLRIDANQQWTRVEIEKLGAGIDCSRIEWLEDPLIDSEEYKAWGRISSIPLALDETLYHKPLNSLEGLPLKALILKPTLLGWAALQHYLQLAKDQQWRTVISSSFEGPVGLAKLHSIALQYAPDEYHGLDTLKYFKREYQKGLHPGAMKLLERWQW